MSRHDVMITNNPALCMLYRLIHVLFPCSPDFSPLVICPSFIPVTHPTTHPHCLGICMGNPWVLLSVPIPVPVPYPYPQPAGHEPRVTAGTGFIRGHINKNTCINHLLEYNYQTTLRAGACRHGIEVGPEKWKKRNGPGRHMCPLGQRKEKKKKRKNTVVVPPLVRPPSRRCSPLVVILLSRTDLLAAQTRGNPICKSGSHSKEMITSNSTGH